MVGTAGFEPTTTTPPVWCATRLRYAPNGVDSTSFASANLILKGLLPFTAGLCIYYLITARSSSSSAIVCLINCLAWVLSSFCASPESRWRAPVMVNPWS